MAGKCTVVCTTVLTLRLGTQDNTPYKMYRVVNERLRRNRYAVF